MLIAFITENWKRILVQYCLGVIILFTLFYSISSMKDTNFRSKMILSPITSPTDASTAVGELFFQMSIKDTLALYAKLGFGNAELKRIKGFEYDILEGGLIEIQVLSADREIVPVFYNSLITYLNEDTILNAESNYKRKIILRQIEQVEKELHSYDSTSNHEESWAYVSEKSNLTPVLQPGASFGKIFLNEKLYELNVELYKLNSVKAFSAAQIPLTPEEPSIITYFMFSNVIVFCLLFIQFLVFSSRRSIDLGRNAD